MSHHELTLAYQRLLQAARPSGAREDLLTASELDRARVVQSAPVRRLQQKTQVFPLDVKASVRSRLTHSLEVQQVARQLSLQLLHRMPHLQPLLMPWLNLLEMAALLHDVGNPPFGHFGESVIREWLAKHLDHAFTLSLGRTPSADWLQRLRPDLLAFDGNAQSLRLVQSLQRLDLTCSLLATLIKVPRGVTEGVADGEGPGFFCSEQPLMQQLRQSLGLQAGMRMPLVYLLEVADDLCYCIADLEDAVDRGLLTLTDVLSSLQAAEVDAGYLAAVIAQSTTAEEGFFTAFRQRLSTDVIAVAVATYCAHETQIVQGSFRATLLDKQAPAVQLLSHLRTLAREQIFRSREVEALELEGYAAISGVLDRYGQLLTLSATAFSELLQQGKGSPLLQRLVRRLSRRHLDAYCRGLETRVEPGDEEEWEWYLRVRLLIDYVSGMTDTYVQAEYRLLQGS